VYFAELKIREPEHAFLQAVEPEQEKGSKVRHVIPMLFTDKVYKCLKCGQTSLMLQKVDL
jgi:hypothetical protein